MSKKPYVSHSVLSAQVASLTVTKNMWERNYRELLVSFDKLREEVAELKQGKAPGFGHDPGPWVKASDKWHQAFRDVDPPLFGDDIEDLKKELNVR